MKCTGCNSNFLLCGVSTSVEPRLGGIRITFTLLVVFVNIEDVIIVSVFGTVLSP